MSLKPIRPRLRNMSKDVAKLAVHIPPGDEVEVSEEVAAQIVAESTAVRPVDDWAPAPAPTPAEVAQAEAAAAASDEEVDEKPVKRPRKAKG